MHGGNCVASGRHYVVMVRLIVVVSVVVPAVPVMVMVAVPVAAALVASIFITDVHVPPGIVTGANDTDTPVGKPDTDKVTGELKPLPGVTVMVERATVSLDIVIEEGEALRLNSPVTGVVVTVKVTLVVSVTLPAVPVTVIV